MIRQNPNLDKANPADEASSASTAGTTIEAKTVCPATEVELPAEARVVRRRARERTNRRGAAVRACPAGSSRTRPPGGWPRLRPVLVDHLFVLGQQPAVAIKEIAASAYVYWANDIKRFEKTSFQASQQKGKAR